MDRNMKKMIYIAVALSFVAGVLAGIASVQLVAKSTNKIDIAGEVFVKDAKQ